jgi:hypothetical protein
MSASTAAFAHQPVYSPWFTFATQAPWEPGVYAVLTGGGESRFSYWCGDCWHCTAPNAAEAHEMSGHPTGCVIVDWRGIVPPSRLERFVSETWAEALARVPALGFFHGKLVADHVAEVCHLLDCKPGYELLQLLLVPASPAVFLYRRRDHS